MNSAGEGALQPPPHSSRAEDWEPVVISAALSVQDWRGCRVERLVDQAEGGQLAPALDLGIKVRREDFRNGVLYIVRVRGTEDNSPPRPGSTAAPAAGQRSSTALPFPF